MQELGVSQATVWAQYVLFKGLVSSSYRYPAPESWTCKITAAVLFHPLFSFAVYNVPKTFFNFPSSFAPIF